MTVRLSAFRSSLDKRPRAFTWSLEYFATKLTTFVLHPEVPERIEHERELVRAGKADGWLAEQVERHGVQHVLDKVIPSRAKGMLPAWSPAVYPDGATRAAANVEVVSCLVLDVDDGADLDTVWKLWSAHPRLLHTSWSHSEAKPKCRLVVPLAEPIPVAAWERVWLWATLQARRGGVTPDKQCSDPSRLFFAPAVPSNHTPREARTHLDGERLRVDWQAIPDPAAAREAARRAAPPVVLPKGDPRRERFAYADPAARESVAVRIGCRILGAGPSRRADRIPCPGCGRASVFFYIDPQRMQSARCDHRQSCGWFGPLRDLEATCQT